MVLSVTLCGLIIAQIAATSVLHQLAWSPVPSRPAPRGAGFWRRARRQTGSVEGRVLRARKMAAA